MSYDLILLRREYIEADDADLVATISRTEAEAILTELPGVRRLSPTAYRYEEATGKLLLEIGLSETGEESSLKSVVFRFSYNHSPESCRNHVDEAYRLAFGMAEKLDLGVFDPQVGGFVTPEDQERARDQVEKRAMQSQEYRKSHPLPQPAGFLDKLKKMFRKGSF